MPRRDGPYVRMETLSVEQRLQELDRCQEHWYRLVSSYVHGKSVLDVGAGTGYGLKILATTALSVDGTDPLPVGHGVVNLDIGTYPDGSFDVCVAMDVIEHVDDDVGFLAHLLRVAREAVFISTPNWNRFHCSNQYHVREYTPAELASLLEGLLYEPWQSDDHPTKHFPWRTSEFAEEATNFGVWIWKGTPLRRKERG